MRNPLLSTLVEILAIQRLIHQAQKAMDGDPGFQDSFELADAMRKLLEELDRLIVEKQIN